MKSSLFCSLYTLFAIVMSLSSNKFFQLPYTFTYPIDIFNLLFHLGTYLLLLDNNIYRCIKGNCRQLTSHRSIIAWMYTVWKQCVFLAFFCHLTIENNALNRDLNLDIEKWDSPSQSDKTTSNEPKKPRSSLAVICDRFFAISLTVGTC